MIVYPRSNCEKGVDERDKAIACKPCNKWIKCR